MTHVVIFTGGLYPAPSDTEEYWRARRPEAVIAADSGADTAMEYCRYFATEAFLPSLAVGDFDSASNAENIPKGCRVAKCEAAKDLSDTEIALLRAREMGDVFVTLVGGDGGRLDHLLAIYDTFSTARHADVWLAKEQMAVFVGEGFTAHLTGVQEGEIVSVARLTGERTGGTFETQGLVWDGKLFRREGMPSLSNWASKGGEVKITVHGTSVLVITGYKNRIEVSGRERQ